jgi:hypothetical protein
VKHFSVGSLSAVGAVGGCVYHGRFHGIAIGSSLVPVHKH